MAFAKFNSRISCTDPIPTCRLDEMNLYSILNDQNQAYWTFGETLAGNSLCDFSANVTTMIYLTLVSWQKILYS